MDTASNTMAKRKTKSRELAVVHQNRIWETEIAYIDSPFRELSKIASYKLQIFSQPKFDFDQGKSVGHWLATIVRPTNLLLTLPNSHPQKGLKLQKGLTF